MNKIELELSNDEMFYLKSEIDILLRSYRENYNGIHYDNDTMGEAFNKVYKALSGKNHPRYDEVKLQEQEQINIALENADENSYSVGIGEKCILCGNNTGEKNVVVCCSCANEYQFE